MQATLASEHVHLGGAANAGAKDDAAIRLTPDSVSYRTRRGAAYAGNGNFARAIADYDQALGLEPKNSGVYFSRGISNLYGVSAAKALADFDQAIKQRTSSSAENILTSASRPEQMRLDETVIEFFCLCGLEMVLLLEAPFLIYTSTGLTA